MAQEHKAIYDKINAAFGFQDLRLKYFFDSRTTQNAKHVIILAIVFTIREENYILFYKCQEQHNDFLIISMLSGKRIFLANTRATDTDFKLRSCLLDLASIFVEHDAGLLATRGASAINFDFGFEIKESKLFLKDKNTQEYKYTIEINGESLMCQSNNGDMSAMYSLSAFEKMLGMKDDANFLNMIFANQKYNLGAYEALKNYFYWDIIGHIMRAIYTN